MNVLIALLSALVSYLFGAISFSRIVTRIVAPDLDIENVKLPTLDGSEGPPMRQIGATTASLELGSRVGCAISLLDILKGLLPTLAFKLLFPEDFYFLIAAFFAVVGHNWPVYYRFRGGGGISPTIGGFFVVDFVGTIVSSFAGLVLGLFIKRNFLLTYISPLWFMLLWLIIFKGEWYYIVYGILVNILFILTFIPDIIKARQSGPREPREDVDMAEVMELYPAGRGMLKIMRFFGTEPKKKIKENDD